MGVGRDKSNSRDIANWGQTVAAAALELADMVAATVVVAPSGVGPVTPPESMPVPVAAMAAVAATVAAGAEPHFLSQISGGGETFLVFRGLLNFLIVS